MDDLSGRVALVTGGDRGIGRAIALALGRAGAAIGVHYHSHAEDAAVVCAELDGLGRRGFAVQADLATATDAAGLVKVVERELGGVEILVNNAGIAEPRTLEELTEADWDRHIAVNLTAAFLLTQAVLPGFRARHWGRIINLSSTAAQVGGIVGPHYAAAKAGLLGLTHAYAALLAKEGITVNAIAPALIETQMLANLPKAQPERIPVGRFGTVEEVAEVALMLASNGYVTGQTIQVNGGAYMT